MASASLQCCAHCGLFPLQLQHPLAPQHKTEPVCAIDGGHHIRQPFAHGRCTAQANSGSSTAAAAGTGAGSSAEAGKREEGGEGEQRPATILTAGAAGGSGGRHAASSEHRDVLGPQGNARRSDASEALVAAAGYQVLQKAGRRHFPEHSSSRRATWRAWRWLGISDGRGRPTGLKGGRPTGLKGATSRAHAATESGTADAVTRGFGAGGRACTGLGTGAGRGARTATEARIARWEATCAGTSHACCAGRVSRLMAGPFGCSAAKGESMDDAKLKLIGSHAPYLANPFPVGWQRVQERRIPAMHSAAAALSAPAEQNRRMQRRAVGDTRRPVSAGCVCTPGDKATAHDAAAGHKPPCPLRRCGRRAAIHRQAAAPGH